MLNCYATTIRRVNGQFFECDKCIDHFISIISLTKESQG